MVSGSPPQCPGTITRPRVGVGVSPSTSCPNVGLHTPPVSVRPRVAQGNILSTDPKENPDGYGRKVRSFTSPTRTHRRTTLSGERVPRVHLGSSFGPLTTERTKTTLTSRGTTTGNQTEWQSYRCRGPVGSYRERSEVLSTNECAPGQEAPNPAYGDRKLSHS